MFVCYIRVKLAGNFIIAIINSSSSNSSSSSIGKIEANSSNRAVCKMKASNRCLSNGQLQIFNIYTDKHTQTRIHILYKAISESFKRQSHFVFFFSSFEFDHHETVHYPTLIGVILPLTHTISLLSNLFVFEGPLSNIANRRI